MFTFLLGYRVCLHQNHNKIQKCPPVNLHLRPDFGSLETISLELSILENIALTSE